MTSEESIQPASTVESNRDSKRDEIIIYLDTLFHKALNKAPFDVLCTVLRVSGMQDAGWDPFEESTQASDDLNWLLTKAHERSPKAAWRIALLYYCQLVEMSAAHDILANLLRILNNEPFIIQPFHDKVRRKKNSLWDRTPPSATTKFKRIREFAEKASEHKLVTLVDDFFDDEVRNAFSHSDYIITEDQFRVTESGFGKVLGLAQLSETINLAFDFYGALIVCHRRWQHCFASMPKYHKWQNYEVLEILSSESKELLGFHVHFSNGSKATYARSPKGVETINFSFGNDGQVGFMVGLIDALEKKWKIDGVEVTDWGKLRPELSTELPPPSQDPVSSAPN
jgi:hypothetical protein